MSDPHGEITIIKKKVYHTGGHHGGAWKIAFADFMTAMMAFFLVLWIINATDKDTKMVIARYFNPIKLANPARAHKGVHDSESIKIVSNQTTGEQAPGVEPGPANDAENSDKLGGSAAQRPAGKTPNEFKNQKNDATSSSQQNSADVKPTMSETQLFSDPYQSLDKIAGGRSSDVGESEPSREAGTTSIDAFRDPFKPIGPAALSEQAILDSDASPPPSSDQRHNPNPQKDGKLGAVTPSPAPAEPTQSPNDQAVTAAAAAAPSTPAPQVEASPQAGKGARIGPLTS